MYYFNPFIFYVSCFDFTMDRKFILCSRKNDEGTGATENHIFMATLIKKIPKIGYSGCT